MNNSPTPSCATTCLRLASIGIFLLLTTSLVSTTAQAKYGPDDEAETLEAMRPKLEKEAPLPAFPVMKNLLTVDTGPTARQAFAIDPASLSIADQYVVRYTVVATSSSGAKNVSFEGINCMSMQFKRYAYGTRDGKWVRPREEKWAPISSMAQNQFHHTVRQFFFCQAGFPAGTPQDILDRVRDNRPLMNQ